MAALPNLITVEQFHELPDNGKGYPPSQPLTAGHTNHRSARAGCARHRPSYRSAGQAGRPTPRLQRGREGEAAVALTAFGSDSLRLSDIFE